MDHRVVETRKVSLRMGVLDGLTDRSTKVPLTKRNDLHDDALWFDRPDEPHSAE